MGQKERLKILLSFAPAEFGQSEDWRILQVSPVIQVDSGLEYR